MFVHHAWRGRAAVAATLALVVVATVGCTGPTADPSPEPTTVTTPEPTPEPEVTPTEEPEPEPEGLVRPELMDENSDEGAIAAAEYITLLAYTLPFSGDLDAWAQVSGETCEFCERAAGMREEAVANGYRYEGGEIVIRDEVRIVGREETLGVVGVDVPIAIQEMEELDADGAVLRTWPALEGYFYVEVAHGHQGWVLMTAHSHAVAY